MWVFSGAECLVNEEAAFLENFQQDFAPSLKEVIRKITSIVGLEYYGIDCHLCADQQMLVFEINANMNVIRPREDYPRWDKPVKQIKNALNALIVRVGASVKERL